jgi:hypothetical protein
VDVVVSQDKEAKKMVRKGERGRQNNEVVMTKSR